MIKFKYKNNEYTIFFYPCNCLMSVTEKNTNRTREFKYNKSTTVKHFLNVLEKIQF